MKLAKWAAFMLVPSFGLNTYAMELDMKPGLWEHTFKLSQDSMAAVAGVQQEQIDQAMDEMKKQMANMSPEQRKMMEDMMAKHGVQVSDRGIDLAAQGVQISKDGTVIKVCVTPEDIARGEMPQTDENCEQKVTQVSAKVLKVTYACKGENPTKGEGQIIFQNDKSYTGTTKFTTQINDKMETIEGTNTGRWLSNNCGNIKPASPTAK